MCLQDQGIDDNNGVVGRVIQARGLNNYDGGVGRGQGIDNAFEGSETTTEAARIWGQRRRLQRRDDGPEELATTAEALVEEDEPEVLTTTMEASS